MADSDQFGRDNVVPIILRPCDWSETPLAQLAAFPNDAIAVTSWKNQDEAFTQIAKEIRRIVETLHNANENE